MMRYCAVILLSIMTIAVFSQDSLRVYPTNWWVGMKHNDVQVMIHFKHIAEGGPVSVSYPGVQLTGTHKSENPNYLFLRLKIAPTAQPGMVPIKIGATLIRWPLLARRAGNGTQFAQGVTSSDFIYFLMPDRHN